MMILKQQKKREIREKEEHMDKFRDENGKLSSFHLFYEGSPILKQASILTNQVHRETKIAEIRRKFVKKLRELSDCSRDNRMDIFDSNSINTRVRGEGLEDVLRLNDNGNLVLRYGQAGKKVETEQFVDKSVKLSVKLPLRFKNYIKSKYAIKDK
jgi:hypothetical protein